MKKSRYTEEQIIGILKQHQAGLKTADLCLGTGAIHFRRYNNSLCYAKAPVMLYGYDQVV